MRAASSDDARCLFPAQNGRESSAQEKIHVSGCKAEIPADPALNPEPSVGLTLAPAPPASESDPDEVSSIARNFSCIRKAALTLAFAFFRVDRTQLIQTLPAMQNLCPLELQIEHSARSTKEAENSPTSKSPLGFKSWKDQAQSCVTQDAKLRKMWLEPDWMGFKVRSKNYLQTKLKETTESPLFELVWFDLFSGKHEDLLHISQSGKSFVQKAIAKYGNDVPQLFAVTLIIPGTPLVACVQYFALKKEIGAHARVHREGETLWKRFLNGDDAFRKSRFKLIPGIPEGPWVVKKSVGAKPVILSHGLEVSYFQGQTYLEAVVDVSSDRVAKHVAALCRSHSTSLKVDMGFVVEGLDETELPEVLLSCVQYDHIDLTLATPI